MREKFITFKLLLSFLAHSLLISCAKDYKAPNQNYVYYPESGKFVLSDSNIETSHEDITDPKSTTSTILDSTNANLATDKYEADAVDIGLFVSSITLPLMLPHAIFTITTEPSAAGQSPSSQRTHTS